jgi:protein-disulfide isomerase
VGLKPEQCLGGELDAPILIEVFSDFECPACREFYLNTIRPVLREYCSLDKVCVVYHEFPLAGHKYSRQAAQYSKAAQRLGQKQWHAVLDALYENQEKWYQNGSVDDVVFKALGADEYFRVRKLLLDPSIDTAIESEIAVGQKKEVTSTPTFFVVAMGKEQKVVGGLPYPVLKGFLDGIVK